MSVDARSSGETRTAPDDVLLRNAIDDVEECRRLNTYTTKFDGQCCSGVPTAKLDRVLSAARRVVRSRSVEETRDARTALSESEQALVRRMTDIAEYRLVAGVTRHELDRMLAIIDRLSGGSEEPTTCLRCSKPIITDLVAWMYGSDDELDDMCQCPREREDEPTNGVLKPCPFCGEALDDACVEDINEGVGFTPSYVVACRGCGASSDYERVQDDAIAAWNRRASSLPDSREGQHG